MARLGAAARTAPSFGFGGDRSTTVRQVVAALAVSLVTGLSVVAVPSGLAAFGLLGAGAMVAIGLLRPALFLALFVLLRPILDQFSQVTAGGANLAGAFGGLLVVVTIVTFVLRRRSMTIPPTTGALGLIAAVSVAAAANASFGLGSVVGVAPASEVIRLVALVAIFVLAANMVATTEQAQRLFVIVGLSALVPTVWGLFELVFGAPVKAGTNVARISGTFTGPVPFGAFLGLTSLVMIFGPLDRLNPKIRWTLLLGMLVALTASYSRVGWVIFLLGLLILGWRSHKPFVAGVVVAFALLIVTVPSVRERALPVSSSSDTSTTTSEAGYESYSWRLSNWGGLLKQWERRPVFGWGLNSVTYVNPRSPVGDQDTPGMGFEAHNMIVRILVEGGVVLLFVYLAYFAAVMRRLRRLSRLPWEMAGQARLLFVLWGLTLFAGITTDDPFALTALMVALLALTGAVEGAYRSVSREKRQEWRRATEKRRWEPPAVQTGVPA